MDNKGGADGNRIFSMATMNVDTLRTMGAIDTLITNLQANNIDISRIQETNNNRSDHVERGNYTIFVIGEDSSNGRETTNNPIRGGGAVIIKTSGNNITQIRRHSGRPMEIQLKTIGNTPIVNIINTYAPDMSYDGESRNKQLGGTREITKQIPLKNVI